MCMHQIKKAIKCRVQTGKIEKKKNRSMIMIVNFNILLLTIDRTRQKISKDTVFNDIINQQDLIDIFRCTASK